MRRILKLKAKHPASFRYYKVMKEVMTSGDGAVAEEKEKTEKALRGMAKEGKEYAKLRGMENVLRQFVKLGFEKGKVVGGDGAIVKSSSCWMRTTSMPW